MLRQINCPHCHSSPLISHCSLQYLLFYQKELGVFLGLLRHEFNLWLPTLGEFLLLDLFGLHLPLHYAVCMHSIFLNTLFLCLYCTIYLYTRKLLQ